MESNKEKLVNQIYYRLDIYHNQLNANRDKFDKVYNEIISSFSSIRNVILSVIPFIITLLFTLESSDIFKEFTGLSISGMNLTIGVLLSAISGFVVYFIFFFKNHKKSKKYLEIQRTFHDGYTTINFMKGFINNHIYIDQLNEDQLESLNKYFIILQGRIVHQISNTIINNNIDKKITEEYIYGKNEKKLYDILIDRACKFHKSNENTKEEILKYFKEPKPDALFSIFNHTYIKGLNCENMQK